MQAWVEIVSKSEGQSECECERILLFKCAV